jgi:hypothetical protein
MAEPTTCQAPVTSAASSGNAAKRTRAGMTRRRMGVFMLTLQRLRFGLSKQRVQGAAVEEFSA